MSVLTLVVLEMNVCVRVIVLTPLASGEGVGEWAKPQSLAAPTSLEFLLENRESTLFLKIARIEANQVRSVRRALGGQRRDA